MMQRNICLIQHGPPDRPPLFLFHDAGGTVASYHRLGSLGRNVYGINNPRFESGRPWHGGLSQMAQTYARLIAAKLAPGSSVLLGGWSFGGLLALEAADVLSRHARYSISVLGVFMIDSAFPQDRCSANQQTQCKSFRYALDRIDPMMQPAMRHMFLQSRKVAMDWTPPQWSNGSLSSGSASEQSDESESEESLAGHDHPPVTLFRCCMSLPGVSSPACVDAYRHDYFLGWEHHRPGLVHRTEDLECGHFDVFDSSNALHVTSKLNVALSSAEKHGFFRIST